MFRQWFLVPWLRRPEMPWEQLWIVEWVDAEVAAAVYWLLFRQVPMLVAHVWLALEITMSEIVAGPHVAPTAQGAPWEGFVVEIFAVIVGLHLLAVEDLVLAKHLGVVDKSVFQESVCSNPIIFF